MIFISIYNFINWILFVNIEKLASPDFYKYYFEFRNLISGKLFFKNSPPLFVLLMGLGGKFLNLFVKSKDFYILSGRMISLVAMTGFIIFFYKFMKKITKDYSIIFTIFLMLTPFYLKFLALPLTDPLYILFVMSGFYFFYERKIRESIISVVSGILTRFEGILLFISAIVNYLKFEKKYLKKYLVYLMLSIPFLILFYVKFSNRLYDKIKLLVSSNYMFLFINNPNIILHLYYDNLLFFIPYKYPSNIMWFLLYLLIIMFFVGLYRLYLINKMFSVSLFLYYLLFTFSKGYIVSRGSISMLRSQTQFRRMFSSILVFYVFVVIGFYFSSKYLYKLIKNKKIIEILMFSLTLIFLFTLKDYGINKTIVVVLIVLMVPFIYLVKEIKKPRIVKLTLLLIFVLLINNFYIKSFKISYRYYDSIANKGAYLIAKWINRNMKNGEKILIYSSKPAIEFYLEKSIRLQYFVFRDKAVYTSGEKLIKRLMKKIKEEKIRYIGIDNYYNTLDRPGETAIKNLLHFLKERENSYFKTVYTLIYKGKYVGSILKVK